MPSVAEALKRYIEDARPRVAHAEVFLRTQAPRSPILATAIYSIVSRRLRALDIQAAHLGPHTLRHTTAVHLLRAGVDLNTIRAWLGHVSLDTTHIYAEVDLQMKAKALASVDITDLPAARVKSPGKADSIMNFMKQL